MFPSGFEFDRSSNNQASLYYQQQHQAPPQQQQHGAFAGVVQQPPSNPFTNPQFVQPVNNPFVSVSSNPPMTAYSSPQVHANAGQGAAPGMIVYVPVPYMVPAYSQAPIQYPMQFQQSQSAPIVAPSNPAPQHFHAQTAAAQPMSPLMTPNLNDINSMLNAAAPADTIKQRCKRCGQYFFESENGPQQCRHHPGSYQSSRFQLLGSFVRSWSCCKKPEQDAVGCKTASHSKCRVTASNMETLQRLQASRGVVSNHHQEMMANSQQQQQQQQPQMTLQGYRLTALTQAMSTRVSQLVRTPDVVASPVEQPNISAPTVESINTAQMSMSRSSDSDFSHLLADVERTMVEIDGKQFVRHAVDSSSDTITGLGLKYQITADELKRVNKIRNDFELCTRAHILVPYRGQTVPQLNDTQKQQKVADLQRRMINRFVREFKCLEAEAKYYLEISQYRYDDAARERTEDMTWEQMQQQQQNQYGGRYNGTVPAAGFSSQKV